MSSLQPTPAKICCMFNATPAYPAEAETLSHPKRWVKGLDDTTLQQIFSLLPQYKLHLLHSPELEEGRYFTHVAAYWKYRQLLLLTIFVILDKNSQTL